MGLWEEVVAFKEKYCAYFHPLHEATVRERVRKIEKDDRRCPCCPDERKCICPQALSELRGPKMSCHCLLFVSRQYLEEWGYIDGNGNITKKRKKR